MRLHGILGLHHQVRTYYHLKIHSFSILAQFFFFWFFLFPSSGGSAYSYCGNMDQSVCCYVPRGARPIGLLPVLNKSKCGRKGNVAAAVGDRKRSDGLADLGEWPWHVRSRSPTAQTSSHPISLLSCAHTHNRLLLKAHRSRDSFLRQGLLYMSGGGGSFFLFLPGLDSWTIFSPISSQRAEEEEEEEEKFGYN
jgi:hypothetical protein